MGRRQQWLVLFDQLAISTAEVVDTVSQIFCRSLSFLSVGGLGECFCQIKASFCDAVDFPALKVDKAPKP